MQTATYAIGLDQPVLRIPATTASVNPGDTIVHHGSRRIAERHDAGGNLHTGDGLITAGSPLLLLTRPAPTTVPTGWRRAHFRARIHGVGRRASTGRCSSSRRRSPASSAALA